MKHFTKILIGIIIVAIVGYFGYMASQESKNRQDAATATNTKSQTNVNNDDPQAQEMAELREKARKGEPFPLPDFNFKDSEGQDIKISDLKKDLIVVNFWASWCHICVHEMPDFQEVYNEYKDNDRVAFMMVNVVDGTRETAEKGKEFFAKKNYTMPRYVDEQGAAFSTMGLRGLPTTFLLNSKGELLALGKGFSGNFDYIKLGAISADDLRTLIEKELEK